MPTKKEQLKQIQHSCQSGGVVRVIDIKTSYLKLCDLCGGKIVKFSEEILRKSPYSPFALRNCNEDDIERLYILISTVIIQSNPEISLSAVHIEILRESLKLAYNAHTKSLESAESHGTEVDPHPIWPDIVSQMPVASKNLEASGVKGTDKAREELSLWSVNLYPTGAYGFIFSQHEKNESTTIDCKFLVYDLDGITDPVMRQIAAMMAFNKISKDFEELPFSLPKFIILEEFGVLVAGSDKAQEIIVKYTQNIAKTAAKLNGQVLPNTNNVADYLTPAGKVLWEQATFKYFFPLGESLYASVIEAWNDELNEADKQILRSLEKNFDQKYSQAYVMSSNEVAPYKGSILLPLSPLMDAVTTTSGKQVELYKKLRTEGYAADDAIIYMADNHPYGEGL